MPGQTISKILEPRTYKAFYQLVQDYSEDVISRISVLSMSSDMVNRLLQNVTDKPVPQSFRDGVAQLARDAGHLLDSTRTYFWPQTTPGTPVQNIDMANRERWMPYDGAAWDRFFEGLIMHVRPRLNLIRQRIYELEIPESLSGEDDFDSESTLNNRLLYVRGVKERLTDAISSIEEIIDPADLESRMTANAIRLYGSYEAFLNSKIKS